MRAENCGRHGAFVEGVWYAYEKICRRFVCDACGGGITHSIVREGERAVDRVACARCGSEEIISESQYMQQISDAAEVLSKPHFRKLFGIQPDRVDAEQAIDELFGEEQ